MLASRFFVLVALVFISASSQTVLTLQSLLPRINAGYTFIKNVPNNFVFAYDGSPGPDGLMVAIRDGTNDMYDTGNRLHTNLGVDIKYSNGYIRSGSNATALGNGGQYFTAQLPGLFVFAGDIVGVTEFGITGNLGSDSRTVNSAWAFPPTQVEGVTHYGFVKQNYENTSSSSNDPSINHIIIVVGPSAPPTQTINDYRAVPADLDQHTVTFSGASRVYMLLYADRPGTLMPTSVAHNVYWSFLELVELFVPSQWTTVTACPGHTYGGGAVVVDNSVLYTDGYESYKYFYQTDTWTTLAAQAPVTHPSVTAGPMSFTSVLVVGGSATTYYRDVFELSHTGTWTTRAPIPTARAQMAIAFDGDHNTVWLSGGLAGPTTLSNTVWAYAVSTDTWTTKAALPRARYQSQTAYTYGTLVSIGGRNPTAPTLATSTLLYTVAQDTWTSASPAPSERCGVHSVAASDNYVFTMGGFPPNQHTNMFRYHVPSDEWLWIQSAPRSGYLGTLVYLRTGVIAMVGPDKHMHTYNTGLVARVIGDPEVTAFDGRVQHLTLWPGIFNLLTTPAVIVNAAVENVLTLPPDENLVVTMVGIVAWLTADSIVIVDCVASESGFLCNEKIDQPASSAHTNVSIASLSETGFFVTLADFTVEVHFRRRALLAAVAPGVVEAFPTSCWLDLVVRSHTGLTPGAVGLLAPSSANEVGDYEVAGGCLFALETKASAGVFTLSDDIPLS